MSVFIFTWKVAEIALDVTKKKSPIALILLYAGIKGYVNFRCLLHVFIICRIFLLFVENASDTKLEMLLFPIRCWALL